MRKHLRTLADVLTGARAVLGAVIAWLGVAMGAEALPWVGLGVVASWVTDLLDGPLARRSGLAQQSWLGAHDPEADLSTSLGVSAFLATSGFVSPWFAAGLVLATVVVWVRFSYALAWPLYALPYALFIRIALLTLPLLGWGLVLYLAGLLLARRRRMRDEYLPLLTQAVNDLLSRRPADG